MRKITDDDQLLIDRILSLIKSGDNGWKQEIVNCDECIYSHVLSWLRKLTQRDEAFYIAKTGDLLGYSHCTSQLAEFYLSGFGCVLDPCLGARLLVKSMDRVLLETRFFIIGWIPMHKIELYVYGQCIPLLKTWRKNWSEFCLERFENCDSIYTDTVNKVRRSTLCLLWCLTLSKLCSKDIARMIAKMVYQSRFEPHEWLFIS